MKRIDILNPELYTVLTNMFGTVKVTGVGHNGGGCTYQKDKKGDSYYINTVTSAEHYCVNCPVCGDKRSRLYINYLVGANTSYKHKQVKTYHLMDCKNEGCSTWDIYKEIKKRLGRVKELILPKEAPNYMSSFMELPKSVKINTARANIATTTYMVNRGYDLDELANKYQVRSCEVLPSFTALGPLIIFPLIEGNQSVLWQGRRSVDSTDKKLPKYYFPPNSQKNKYLYNKENAFLEKRIYLTEGVLDTIKIGDGAMCFFGKEISMRQTQILATVFSKKEAVLVLDSDVDVTKSSWYRKYKTGLFEKGLRVCKLPELTDPADFPAEVVRDVIDNCII